MQTKVSEPYELSAEVDEMECLPAQGVCFLGRRSASCSLWSLCSILRHGMFSERRLLCTSSTPRETLRL